VATEKHLLLYHNDTIKIAFCLKIFYHYEASLGKASGSHIKQHKQSNMRQFRLFLTGVLVLLISSVANAQAKDSAQAQVKPDYFAGQWNVLVKGTPGGDSKMTLTFERKDTALVATLKDSTGNEAGKVNKVMENDQSVTVYFTAQGYDVDLVLEKKDDDHVTGNLMGGMFEAEGDRVKK
jgi:hypothetical protein